MSRVTITCIALLVMGSSIAAGIATGSVSANSDGGIDDSDIIETQNFTQNGTSLGEVNVEMSYRIGSNIDDFAVYLPNQRTEEIVSLDGFQETATADKYEWDEQTERPSIRVTVKVNETTDQLQGSGYSFVETTEWALVQRLNTGHSISTRSRGDIDVHREVKTDEAGVAGDAMVYYGDHTQHYFNSSGENFHLIISNHTTYAASPDAIFDSLVASSENLSVGEKSEQVTVFILPSPIREGWGRAVGADFKTHEDEAGPDDVLMFHEYVHTRQTFGRAESATWTSEAEAEYYGHLLALQQDKIDYSQFYERFTTSPGKHSGIVLAKPESWESTQADYGYGGLVIAALDAKIRDETDGERNYQDVLRKINERDGDVTLSDIEELASDTADSDMSAFFDRYIRSESEPLDVPPPAALGLTGPQLEVTATDVTESPGTGASIEIEITNTGEAKSATPVVHVSKPDEITHVSQSGPIASPRAWNESSFTVNDLEPGEEVSIRYNTVIDESAVPGERNVGVKVTDVTNKQATATATINVVEESTSTGTPIDTPTETATPTSSGDGSGQTPEPTATSTPAPTPTPGAGGPGFGVVVPLLALVATLIVMRRR